MAFSIKEQLRGHSGQVVILYAATVAGMLFGLLNSVINTRALSTQDYGDFRYVLNIIQFVSSVLLFGYFTSGCRLLALSRGERESRRIRGILCVILGISIIIVMAVLAVLHSLSAARGADGAVSSLFLVAIPVCGNVLLLNYINTVAQGDNQIVRIAVARLVPGAVYAAVAVVLFKFIEVTPARMLLLFNGIPVLVLTVVILSTKPSFKGLGDSFRTLNDENRRYGFNVYLGSLANVSTAYISGITLGLFCSDNIYVGFYNLAMNLAMPLTMLPSIIGTTYFKKFASEERIDRKVIRTSYLLTAVSCVAFVLIIGFVVDLLYDDEYSQVASLAAVLSVGMCLHGLGDMFNRFLGAHGRGKELRNGAFLCGGVILFGSVVLVYLWGIWGAVVTKLAGDAVYFLAMFMYYWRFVNNGSVAV